MFLRMSWSSGLSQSYILVQILKLKYYVKDIYTPFYVVNSWNVFKIISQIELEQ